MQTKNVLKKIAVCFIAARLAFGGCAVFSLTTVYDRSGNVLREYLTAGYEKRAYAPLHLISPNMINAVVAAEDKRFFSHSGTDWFAVARAVWQNITGLEVVSGASTITQQLMRAMTPAKRTLKAKIREAFAAAVYEKEHSKQEIIESYLNTVSFGGNIVGVQAAALTYFGVNAKDLSAAQAAGLAALIKAPSKNSPSQGYAKALGRQKHILKLMLKNGFITEPIYRQAVNEEINFSVNKSAFNAPQFCDFVMRSETNNAGRIYTSLDFAVQKKFESIVLENLKKLAPSNVTNAAVLAVNNKNGNIIAYIGSADYGDEKNEGRNDGVLMLRQPGSALKPFIYALALKKGMTAADIIVDEPTVFPDGFSPKNYSETFHGPVSLRQALASSYNIPAYKAARFSGVIDALDFLRAFGFNSLNKPASYYGLGIALGNGEVSLYQLVAAYAALASGGVLKELSYQIAGLPNAGTRVLDEETAFIVTDILADNSARAPAFGFNSYLKVPFDFAAKTGTSKDYRDNFAIGFTPQWTIGVWVGNFNASPMEGVSGISGAGPILNACARAMALVYPGGKFIKPKAVAAKKICPLSGLACAEGCFSCYEEYFSKNRVLSSCNAHTKQNSAEEELLIEYPKNNSVYIIDYSLAAEMQALVFKAKNGNKVIWHLNGEKIDSDVWPLKSGKYTLYFTDADGRKSEAVAYEVHE